MRARRLGHPVFTGAVAVLAVNDHILKRRWPGPVTGKLSDIAGVVVVAILLSVLVRRRAALATTAAGFVALKSIPAVAAAAAPALGGVTRTDPTDIVALLALVPLWVWLQDGGDGVRRASSSGRRALAAAGVVAAVYATTATSCLEKDEITGVAVQGVVVYAFLDHSTLLDDGGGPEDVYESHDSGETWTASRSEIAFADQTEACTDGDGSGRRCWQVRPEHGVDECATGDECAEVFSFTAEQRARMRCQSSCGFDETFAAVAVLDEDGGMPIVAMGEQGVLVGHTDGSWTRHAVGPAEPLSIAGPPAWTERLVVSPVVLALAGFFVLIVGVAAKRTPYVWAGVAMVLAFVPLIIGGLVTSFDDDGRWPGIVVAALAVAVFTVSLVVAARTVRQPRLEPPAWPPPPGPTPLPFT